MAAATYIQEAAGQVRNAIAALQDEIRTIQQDAYSKESQLKHDADKEENEAEGDKLMASAARDQQGAEAGLRARSFQLEQDAKQKMQEAERKGVEAAQIVQSKNGLINNLHSVLSQLESLASSAR